MITMTIPGIPQGKGRHRSRLAKTKAGKTFIAHHSDPKTASYENQIGWIGKLAMAGQKPWTGAVAMTLYAGVPIPASWSKKKQADALAGRIFPQSKPDLDNIEKAVLDGLNGIVFIDDAQVTDVEKSKRYDANPRIDLVFRQVQS